MEARGACKCEGTRQGNAWRQPTTDKEGVGLNIAVHKRKQRRNLDGGMDPKEKWGPERMWRKT